MQFIDLADEPEIQAQGNPDRGVSLATEDRCFRITVSHIHDPKTGERIPDDKRTWVLWDMREMPRPWGPLSERKGNPIPLLTDIPNLELARVCAILAVHSKVVRGALTARLVLRGMIRQAQAKLDKVKARLGQ